MWFIHWWVLLQSASGDFNGYAGHSHIHVKLEKRMRQGFFWVSRLILLTLLTSGQSPVWAEETQSPRMNAVVAEIGHIGKAARGTVGVAAIHLETGRKIAHNANEFFPMASTVKVAVAAKVLDLVDKGQIRITSRIPIKRSELAPEGPLEDIRWRPGLSFSADDLLEAMITKSDNTSTDVLYRVAGGPASVHAYLQALGLEEIYPARYMRELLRDVLSIPAPASSTISLTDQFRRMSPKQASARHAKAYRANPAYDADPRDQAIPTAMLGLLCKIWLEDGVSRSARSILLPMMERTTTGLKRIRGRLPAGTIVADRTGTLAGTVNDIGFITLPDGKGHIAIVVFVKGSKAPFDAREAVIADIAGLVYDYYLDSAQ
jgi:beta-lactamase class A